ncbi:MAG: hydrogenase expression/formation protein HypE [Lachnospiraceae bacterium]|nr:hydrogenase expression/formation protein HypE [Lachnospiraceae bacterium]
MDNFITLDYGSGGKKTSALISDMILPLLKNEALEELGDGAVIDGAERLVYSTDSFVVSPYFFPGGDIGKLSVCGTVNDISMAGGEPKFLSLGLIIEEGLPVADLQRIIDSIRAAADRAGVKVVTGDTKVVERGRGDGIYINTSGIGFLRTPRLSPRMIREGDAVLVSGTVGDHGTAVMLARNEHLVQADLDSDCAPLNEMALALGKQLGADLRVMRDPTRGGIATTLNEFIEDGRYGIEIMEKDIPVLPAVNMVSEILGLDPYYTACEGRMLAVVDAKAKDRALEILHGFADGTGAAVIGEVTGAHPGKLVIRTPMGGGRIAAKLSGAQLPRIC